MNPAVAILLFAAAFAAPYAGATPDAAAEAEIQALLAYVERSPCTFVRSGSGFDGPAARKHLARKYDHARSMLRTADQFIEHVASGSSLTGEEYRVRCDGHVQRARTWLDAELARMRAGARDAAPRPVQ